MLSFLDQAYKMPVMVKTKTLIKPRGLKRNVPQLEVCERGINHTADEDCRRCGLDSNPDTLEPYPEDVNDLLLAAE